MPPTRGFALVPRYDFGREFSENSLRGSEIPPEGVEKSVWRGKWPVRVVKFHFPFCIEPPQRWQDFENPLDLGLLDLSQTHFDFVSFFSLRNEPPEAKILSVFAFKTSISFRKMLRKRVKTLKIFACGAQGR